MHMGDSPGLGESRIHWDHHQQHQENLGLSQLFRYVLSIKTRNTKWEIDSPWTENRVHWSKGDKGWDSHLELCHAAAGKSMYRTLAMWERPSSLLHLPLSFQQQGFFLFSFFKSGLWALPCASGMWCGMGNKSRAPLGNSIRHFPFSVTLFGTTCPCAWGVQRQRPGLSVKSSPPHSFSQTFPTAPMASALIVSTVCLLSACDRRWGQSWLRLRALQCGCQKMLLLTHQFLVLGGQSQAPSCLEGTFSVFFLSLGVSMALMLPK